MEERALLLALGILAAVVWPGRLAADQPRTKWGAWAVVGAGLAVLLVWYAWRFSAKFGLWIPNPFLFVPVDSLLIGYLVGHIIPGGRRPEATRADAAPTGHGQQFLPSDVASVDGRQHPAAAQPNNNEGAGRGVREATDRALGWAASLLATVRGTVTGVAVVALLVLGVVPPQTWGHFVHRLEGLKAAGVEFTLGTVVGDKAAQDISVAALPPGNLDGKSEEDRHGFVPPRLDRMKNLTFPVSLPEEQGPETVLERNPTYFLFAKHVEARRRTSGPSERQPHVRGVQRDRAMLLHLHRAGAAVDTRRPGRGTSASDERHGASRDEGNIIQGLLDLGAQQEVVLARLADHVACVSEVIKETNDRRLTEYRTARVVEELYMFARIWSSLERSHVMYGFGLGHSVGDAARAAAFRELLLRTHLLTLRIKEFTWWADNTIQALRAGRAEATTAGTGGASPGRGLPSNRDQEAPIPPSPALVLAAASTALVPSAEGSSGSSASRFAMPPNRGPGVEKRVPVSSRCDFGQEAVAAIEEAINPAQSDGTRRLSVPDDEALRRSDEMFARQGFTPYLVTFVAQALSAMGDHNAALRLLVGWQQDLVWLAHLAGSGDGLLDRTGAQPTPRMRPALKPEEEATRRAEIERLGLAAPWYRLTTFVDTIVLQELSENTDFAVIPTEDGLRHLIVRLFPDVLSRVSQGSLLEDWRAVPDWRVVPNKICRQPSHAWMQSLVLSYATWVKTYLDKRNRNLVRPGDVSEHDLGLADMLLKLNLECFPEELDADQAVRHRAHFAVTAAAIKLNRLVDPRYDAQRRGELQAELEAATRRAVFDLEWLGDRHKAESTNEHPRTPLEKLIFGREDLALRAARSIRTRLDTLASR